MRNRFKKIHSSIEWAWGYLFEVVWSFRGRSAKNKVGVTLAEEVKVSQILAFEANFYHRLTESHIQSGLFFLFGLLNLLCWLLSKFFRNKFPTHCCAVWHCEWDGQMFQCWLSAVYWALWVVGDRYHGGVTTLSCFLCLPAADSDRGRAGSCLCSKFCQLRAILRVVSLNRTRKTM